MHKRFALALLTILLLTLQIQAEDAILNPDQLAFLEKHQYDTEYDKEKQTKLVSILSQLKELIKNQNNAQAQLYAAKVCYALQFIDDASKHINLAISINDKDPEIYFWQALLFRKEKKHLESIKAFKKAIELDPKSTHTLFQLGRTYQFLGDSDKAKEQFILATGVDPADEKTWLELGNIYLEKNEFEKAIESYAQAIKQNPKLILPLYNIGLIYKEKKEFKKAEEYFLKALTLEPNDFYSLKKLTQIYEETQDIKKAEETSKRVVEAFQKSNDPSIKDKYFFVRSFEKNQQYQILGNVYFAVNDITPILYTFNIYQPQTSRIYLKLHVLPREYPHLDKGYQLKVYMINNTEKEIKEYPYTPSFQECKTDVHDYLNKELIKKTNNGFSKP